MIKISSIVIGVHSLTESRSFYEKILGITFSEFRPPFAAFELNGIEFNIEEDSNTRHVAWNSQYIGGRKSVVFEVDNLESFLKQAIKNGAILIQVPEEKTWGYKEAVIADPSNNQFLIEQKL